MCHDLSASHRSWCDVFTYIYLQQAQRPGFILSAILLRPGPLVTINTARHQLFFAVPASMHLFLSAMLALLTSTAFGIAVDPPKSECPDTKCTKDCFTDKFFACATLALKSVTCPSADVKKVQSW